MILPFFGLALAKFDELEKKTGLLGVLALGKRESGFTETETSIKFDQNIKFLSILKNKADKKDATSFSLRYSGFKNFKDINSYS